MLYKKNNTEQLSRDLFKKPTSEYRGTPFWAWNCKLDQKELEWQLEVLKHMGFGGAHMHVRTGMEIPYLGEEHMALVKACVEKAKSEEMLAWLYDEDRWPSGSAGGLVTREERFRCRHLLFTPTPYDNRGTLLCCYDVALDSNGYLMDWKIIKKDEPAEHEKWYAYMELQAPSAWYNNQAYVNTLDKAAMDRFIEITYGSYNRTIAEEFDKTVPAMFTDEPYCALKTVLKYATEKADVILSWTDDLPDSFAAAYNGEDLLAGIPELVWDRADGAVSVLRYHYHDHVCDRFGSAFVDNCGNWCKEHGLELTGHLLGESTLHAQTMIQGEAMRCYRSFGLPGIDMLCAAFEFTTAKQAQSAVHQFGREGMMSELYGVTNWDFDFRGHKLHGDWQAALGVTVRVPHLSLVSLAGESKRDYPASINYQSPWWEKYSLIEDHFARLNTAMTRGKAVVKVGIIHPIESHWLHWGPADSTALIRDNMEQNFQNVTKWLLFGGIDFDFISESLLPELCSKASAPIQVGEMAYDVIIVPGCETLRSTTLERLEDFVAAGGKLIFSGDIPALENARPSKRAAALAAKAAHIQFNKAALLETLESDRVIEIRNEMGNLTENLLYQMRQDGRGRWLFIAHGVEPYNKDISRYQELKIRIAGCWKATVYNTMNGETEEIGQLISNDMTEIYRRMYDYDSLLLWLEPEEGIGLASYNVSEDANCISSVSQNVMARNIPLPLTVPYTLSEPNVLLLDQAEYALDDGEWHSQEEILRLDDACRNQLGWPSRKIRVAQPWAIEKEPITHTVHLRMRILSDIMYAGAQLAIEDAERVQIKWNDQEVDNTVTGWYVDKSIKTVALPPIQVGENNLEIAIPFGKRTAVEWLYLLGDFGVKVVGRSARIVEAVNELTFGDFTQQGLPFYGGNITYHVPIETEGGKLTVRSSRYKGIMQAVAVDYGNEIPVIYPPYTAEFEGLAAGKHTVNIILYGHRRNSFGPVHLADLKERWIGPIAWRSEGECWCYDYIICEEGILTTPEITEE